MSEVEKSRRPKTGGRAPGTPNKVTADARAAIAAFVDHNAPKLQEWLEAVANGDAENDIKPNPTKAFELFQSVIEYHIPKLARQDVTLKGDPNAPVQLVLNGSDIHG